MSKRVCAGCPNVITNNEYMICNKCKDCYDVSCAGMTSTSFKQLSKHNKESWECDGCRNKRPKGNNTESPLNPAKQKSFAATQVTTADTNNVTIRSKQIRSTDSRSGSVGSSEGKRNDELRDLVRAEMLELRKELPSILKAALVKELKPLNEKIFDLITFSEFADKKYDEMKSLLESRNEEIKALKSSNESLSCTVKDLSSRLSALEQHTRETNIEIHGLPEFRSENLPQIVSRIGEVISHPIQDGSIQACFRVAKMDNKSNRPRNVVVKFPSLRKRDAFLADVSRYNKAKKLAEDKLNTCDIGIGGQKSHIYISEHLCPDKKSLHAAARLKKKELRYDYLWIKHGKIFMRENETTPSVLIKNLDSLNRLTPKQ